MYKLEWQPFKMSFGILYYLVSQFYFKCECKKFGFGVWEAIAPLPTEKGQNVNLPPSNT